MLDLKIEVVNVVATANTGHSIDLPRLAKQPHITYNPSRYFCAYFKDDSMEAKVSVFASGKLIAVGAKSEESAKRDLKHVVKALSGFGIVKRSRPEVTVRNIVITVQLGFPVDLDDLQSARPGIVYEPEQFPGAIFRPIDSNATALIFASGKMVVAGIKAEASIDEDVRAVLKELNLEELFQQES